MSTLQDLKPITTEYIRRFSILMLLILFVWMFFYRPADIYEIQVKDYVVEYQDKVKRGSIDASEISLEKYIANEMRSPYAWRGEKEKKIVDVSGEFGAFLNKLVMENRDQSKELFFKKNRSSDTYWSGNSYFFKSSELPINFLSKAHPKDVDYLSIRDKGGKRVYFKFYEARDSFMLDDAPVAIKYPLRLYSYLLLVTSVLIYIFVPRPKVPEGAAYFGRSSAVYIPDMLAFAMWIGVFMLFFLPDDSFPTVIRYFLLCFLGILPLVFIFHSTKYASNWYLFKDDVFRWSDSGGIQSVALSDIVSVKSYKRQLPKWFAPLLLLVGRGQPGPTGVAILSSTAAPEIGMEITIKSGKKIKVMANSLKSDKEFTKRFQELEKRVEGK